MIQCNDAVFYANEIFRVQNILGNDLFIVLPGYSIYKIIPPQDTRVVGKFILRKRTWGEWFIGKSAEQWRLKLYANTSS